MADIALNYVRFKRGTSTAFSNLVSKDSDTLYFIHDDGQITGQLYIGDVLISDNLPDNGDAIAAKLAELEDVNVAGVINGQVLGYDAESEKWIPMTINEAIEVSVMTGASEGAAGKEGLVPAPAAGDQNKFLRGDASWVDINTLIATEVSKLDHLKRQKVDSVEDIDVNAEDAEMYIYMVPTTDSKENNAFEEYIVIDGKIEKLGTYSTGSVGEENLINAVNPDEFVISTDGTKTLSLLEVPATKIIGLENNETFSIIQTDVGSLANEMVKVDNRIDTLEKAVLDLQSSTSWGTI